MSQRTWRDCSVPTSQTTWDKLKPGDKVYCYVQPTDQHLRGPFTVIDPATMLVTNMGGVEITLDFREPFIIDWSKA